MMKMDLLSTQDFLQPYIHAISALLNVAVTVVDSNLVRIAGTSHFEGQLGQKIEHGSFYQHLIATGQPGIVLNMKKTAHCRDCGRHDCSELADIASPIFYGNEVLGIVGIIAFSEEEKAELVSNNKNFEVFLKYMSMLIESKLTTLQQKYALEEQLDEAVSASRQELNEIGFIGRNPKVERILDLCQQVATSDSTVLIMGESGTGKDMLARLIHNMSDRRDRLMIPVNCGAIPDTLIESELFGYEAGSFTGASKNGQPGKFELAHQSTIFLDEIGEMSLHAQTRLLRVLQEKEVHRVGGKKGIPIDVRVICASNQNLLDLVEEKKFRKDLYYRIHVIPVTIPPLRERKDDICFFVYKFIEIYNKRFRKSIQILNKDVMDALANYHWPGNVRELKNLIEYLANIVKTDQIQLSDLPNQFFVSQDCENAQEHSLKTLLAAHEKHILKTALSNARSTEEKQRVAEHLDISLATLYRKMADYQIQ